MKSHLQYLRYVLRHKWYVLIECWRMGLFWRGIVHDLSKFTPAEWFPYVAFFYGPKHENKNSFELDVATGKLRNVLEVPEQAKRDFDVALCSHFRRNSHHWQYWLLQADKPRPEFWFQSYDGGMTHITIADKDGKLAAVVYDGEWNWRLNANASDRLKSALMFTPVALEMPYVDMVEMLCDWRGAGKALGKPDTLAWYRNNKDNMRLHPNTRTWIEYKLGYEPPTHPELLAEFHHQEGIRNMVGVGGNSSRYDYP